MYQVELSLLKRLLLNSDMEERALVKEIVKVSKSFTSDRSRIGNYILTEEGVSGYTYFYLPTNIPKFSFVLNQIPEYLKKTLSQLSFYDIGCGPGTYSLAFGAWASAENGKIICIDQSGLMLQQSKKILSHYLKSWELLFSSDVSDIPVHQDIFAFYGHSINEMGIEDVQKQIRALKPVAVGWIEPGTPTFFPLALELREFLLENGYSNIYPCGPGSGECPLKNHKRDWCHQVWRGKHSDEVERLSQLVQLDRKSMPMTAHLYIKSNLLNEVAKLKPHDESLIKNARLVNFIKETKFSFIWDICINENNYNYQRIEVLKKEMTKGDIKSFQSISPGVACDFTVVKVHSEYKTVKLCSG